MEYAGRDRVLPRMEHTTRTTLQTTSGAADGRYVFDQRRHDERERLAAMERPDPGTRTVIAALGIEPGWRCLEIGAGAGSIARWLADRVGRQSEVVATDISTLHLDGLDAPNIEVRHHDILCDPLPEGAFDLVHARLVVEHLGRRSLQRAASAVRPGGLLVLEDFDWGAALTYANTEQMRQVMDAVTRFMSRAGYDADYGRRLVHESDRPGPSRRGRRRARARVPGRKPEHHVPAPELRVDRRGAALVGELMQEYLDWVLATLDDPDTVFLTPMFAAWGRKPQP